MLSVLQLNPLGVSVIYQRLKFNSVVTQALLSRFLFPIVLYHRKISFYIGRVLRHGPLFIFMFYSHWQLFKQALNQARAVKRVYTVYCEIVLTSS